MADKDSAPDDSDDRQSAPHTDDGAPDAAEPPREAESGETAGTDAAEAPDDGPPASGEGTPSSENPDSNEPAEASAAKSDRPSPEKSSKRRTTKSTAKKPSGATSRKAPLPSEREINSPDFRTLVMLGSVFIVTLGSWGAARFACNVHTPVNREPNAQTTAKLSENPKDAAIELYQRWQTLDFDGALELATGSLAQRIQTDREKCAANESDCAHKRKERSKGLATRGILLSENGDRAVAKVESSLGDQDVATAQLTLVREGPIWKATESSAD